MTFLYSPANSKPGYFQQDDYPIYYWQVIPNIDISETEVLIKIDLTKSVSEQLQKYRKRLLLEQKQSNILRIPARNRIVQLITYLRILDSVADGISPSVAAKIIFLTENAHRQYHSCLARAKALQEQGYKKWLGVSTPQH